VGAEKEEGGGGIERGEKAEKEERGKKTAGAVISSDLRKRKKKKGESFFHSLTIDDSKEKGGWGERGTGPGKGEMAGSERTFTQIFYRAPQSRRARSNCLGARRNREKEKKGEKDGDEDSAENKRRGGGVAEIDQVT